jgi:hypothetical protein
MATVATDTLTAAAAGAEAAITPPPRLLDSDSRKFRSLKQVIVVGRPGSGADGEFSYASQLLLRH